MSLFVLGFSSIIQDEEESKGPRIQAQEPSIQKGNDDMSIQSLSLSSSLLGEGVEEESSSFLLFVHNG